MSEYQNLKFTNNGEHVTITLNRPPLNVLNIAMMKEINSALQEVSPNAQAKALVFRAEGKAFSAGVDIADHTAEKVDEMMREFHQIFELMHSITIPIIAVVDGAALGGGCELAIYCDMVIASEKSKFGQPEIKVGVFPPVAAAIFPRLIGRNRSLEYLLNGEVITATEAERIGLINHVYPVENFETKVSEFIGKITSNSKIILELTKKALDKGLQQPCMEAMRRAEEVYMNEVMKTHDAHEGLEAFMQKRPPIWSNK